MSRADPRAATAANVLLGFVVWATSTACATASNTAPTLASATASSSSSSSSLSPAASPAGLASSVSSSSTLSSAASAPSRPMTTEAARATLDAELALQRGDLLGAVTAWQRAVRADEGSVYLRLRLAEAYVALGDADAAAAMAEEALELAERVDPHGEQTLAALCGLAFAQLERGQLDDAEARLREALRRRPGHPRASAMLAERLVVRGALDEAEAVVARWSEADPTTTGEVALARVFAERRELERAHRHLDAALARVDGDEAALRLKLQLSLAAGDDTDAVVVARALMAALGDGQETRSELLVTLALAEPAQARVVADGLLSEEPSEASLLLVADAFERAGRIDDAIGILRRSLVDGGRVVPGSVAPLELARLVLSSRDAVEARRIACRIAEPATDRDERDEHDERLLDWAVALCAQAELELGQSTLAIERLVRRVAVRPPRARPLRILASALQRVSSSPPLDVARTAARDVLAWQKEKGVDVDPAVVLAVVEVLQAGGDPEAARATSEALLAQRPGERAIVVGHARLLALQATDDAQTLAAVELVERVVERAGGDVDDLNFMAFTLAERGLRPKQALLFAWRAVLLEPLSGSVVDTLGWAQLKAGDVDGAVVALRRAVRLSPNEGEIWFHLAAAEFARGDRRQASEAIERALALLPRTDPIRARATALLSAP